MARLEIELVPSGAWFKNLRSMLPKGCWDRLRSAAYKRAGYRCEICGGVGAIHPVECHEEWSYDDVNHVATLSRLIALCPSCHEVKHIGLARINGNFQRALKHMSAVNNVTETESLTAVARAFKQWNIRSRFDWVIDIGTVSKMP